MAEINRRWVLANRPQGAIKNEDFRRDDGPAPSPGPGQIVVRVTHLSFDPTQRGWMAEDTYLPAVKIGEVMRAGAVGQVVASENPAFKVGQLVQGAFGWQDYALSDGGGFWPVTPLFPGVTPEQALGVFGITGLTAFFGLTDIGRPEAGDTVLASGAAGATGSVAGQIAKILGCRVIGIAGGPEKCRWVVETAGFDACIDYKSENVAKRIRALAPQGVNVIFENVGGEILEAGMMNLANRARIVLCGGISDYNAESLDKMKGLRTYMALTIHRARMEGFIVLDYAPRYGEGVQALAGWIADGKLKAEVDMAQGFEAIPATLRRLFEGKNFGKQLLKIADPPLPVV